MTKPFLKWAGGKYKLVDFIASHFPQNRQRLVEPFAGSAALSLALEFDAYLINDLNQDLINLYATIKNEKKNFIDFAKSYFLTENNQESRFYELRDTFNHSTNPVERSALFIYLNRHAFNGLCRYNSKGIFNVPFGRYKSPYFPEKELLNFLNKSDRIELMCGDFQKTFTQINKYDVVYCDPPYVPLSETASFTTYSQDSFNLDDQKRLAKQAEEKANFSQGIFISNHNTAFTREIYKNANIKTIHVQRNIAAKSSSRKKVEELLAIYNGKSK